MARSLLLTLAPWAGAVVAAGVVGTVVGVSGLVGHPEQHVTVVSVNASLAEQVNASSCPDGPVVGVVHAGTRVVAISRSADSTSVGVRDPHDTGREIWLRASEVTFDASQPAISTLVVEACPITYLSDASAPAPTATETPSPAPGVTDIVKPVITSASANPTEISQHGVNPDKATISAAATDNVGVTKITATWPSTAQVPAGSAQINGASGSFTFGPFDVLPIDGGPPFDVTITLIAHDAAGNSSAPKTVIVNFGYFAG